LYLESSARPESPGHCELGRGRGFDPQTRAATGTDSTGDLLEGLAEQVIRTDGTVVVVPRERMPVSTGLAAIYRF